VSEKSGLGKDWEFEKKRGRARRRGDIEVLGQRRGRKGGK